MKTLRLLIAVTLMAWTIIGCGGDGSEETAQVPETSQTPDAVDTKTQQIADNPNLSQEDKELLTKWANYQTEYDADASYSMADIPDWGNYRKLNFSRFSDEQLNTAIHKLKTTICDCQGCGPEWTLDRCLVVKPECLRGLTMSQTALGQARVLGK